MMPGNAFSAYPVTSAFIDPDGRFKPYYYIDWERGPVAFNDATQGLNYQVWVAWVAGSTIYVQRESGGAITPMITGLTNVTDVALAFDQNAAPVIAYADSGVTSLWWYDYSIPGRRTTVFTGATSPRLCLDDKRASQTGNSDILFFYVKPGSIRYVQQRDLYGVERTLAAVPSGTIAAVGMNLNWRMQLVYRLA